MNGSHSASNSSPSSRAGPTSIDSAEGLLQLFVCPGCQGTIFPPLHQCRKGHLVCDKCRTGLKMICPICKQRFADTTNIMMEQVCQFLRYPCEYSKYGCPEHFTPGKKLEHETFCPFRPVHCQFASSGCKRVMPVEEMMKHVENCSFKEFDSHKESHVKKNDK